MLSIIVPAYNEKDCIRPLYAEIAEQARRSALEIEIVYVDDGSSDGTWANISELAGQDSRVAGIRLRRNFGKSAALSAGFRAARGDIIITMDADLQDDPKEIPRFLDKLAEGYDVISGWKRVRHDPWHKVFPSRVFNFVVSWFTGVWLHDHNCGMKCYRGPIFREIRLYGELHRFIPVMAAARGFRVGEIEVAHRPRRFGHSKYGVRRFARGALDLLTVKFLTGYNQRPQHLLGGIGLVAFLAGNIGLLYLAYTWIVRLWDPQAYPPLHARPLMVYSVAALLVGAQMMCLGFLAELIIAYAGREGDTYSIAERTVPFPADREGPQV
jgi:glycosyltransferase involved in cell wall biosynthesis